MFYQRNRKETRRSLSLTWLFSLAEEDTRAQTHGKTYCNIPPPATLHAGPPAPQPIPFPLHSSQWDVGVPPLHILWGVLDLQNTPQGYLEVSVWFSLLRMPTIWNEFQRTSGERENECRARYMQSHSNCWHVCIIFCVESRLPPSYMFVCTICAHVRKEDVGEPCDSATPHPPFLFRAVPSITPLGWWGEYKAVNRPQGFQTWLDQIGLLCWLCGWAKVLTGVLMGKLFKKMSELMKCSSNNHRTMGSFSEALWLDGSGKTYTPNAWPWDWSVWYGSHQPHVLFGFKLVKIK